MVWITELCLKKSNQSGSFVQKTEGRSIFGGDDSGEWIEPDDRIIEASTILKTWKI